MLRLARAPSTHDTTFKLGREHQEATCPLDLGGRRGPHRALWRHGRKWPLSAPPPPPAKFKSTGRLRVRAYPRLLRRWSLRLGRRLALTRGFKRDRGDGAVSHQSQAQAAVVARQQPEEEEQEEARAAQGRLRGETGEAGSNDDTHASAEGGKNDRPPFERVCPATTSFAQKAREGLCSVLGPGYSLECCGRDSIRSTPDFGLPRPVADQSFNLFAIRCYQLQPIQQTIGQPGQAEAGHPRPSLAVPDDEQAGKVQSSIKAAAQPTSQSRRDDELAEGGGPAAAPACGRPPERRARDGRRRQCQPGKPSAAASVWIGCDAWLPTGDDTHWHSCATTHAYIHSRPLRPATSWSCRRSGRPSARPSAGCVVARSGWAFVVGLSSRCGCGW